MTASRCSDEALAAITDWPWTSADEDIAYLVEFMADRRSRRHRSLGYPSNLELEHSRLGVLLDVTWNNIGDPDAPDGPAHGCKPVERAVVRFLAKVAGGEPEHTYGYVTSGGTEGNLFGAHIGRNRLPTAPLYFSDDAHYAVAKVADLLRMESVRVPSHRDGGFDLAALGRMCEQRRGHGAVVVATIGTTMTGANDDLAGIRQAVAPAGPVHLHVDAALGGLVAAFAPDGPGWGFQHGADSVTISGHKLIGCPIPCGVVLARADLVPPAMAGEYVGTSDSTLACSRDGFSPALLWYSLRRLGRVGLATRVRQGLALARYAHDGLDELGQHPWLGPASLTVAFDRPEPWVCRRWNLATQGDRAHLIAMPHVTRTAIDELCADIAVSKADTTVAA